MRLPPALVLRSPLKDKGDLPQFVERMLSDEVELIAIVGEGCEALEEEIDWLVIGDASNKSRFLVTSSHAGEKLEDAVEFASFWTSKRSGGVELIEF